MASPTKGPPRSGLSQSGPSQVPLLRYLAGRELPEHTWAHGLWEEAPSLRPWHQYLASISFPQVQRSSSADRCCLFTDGSCLAPSKPHLRLPGGAVIQAHSNMTYTVFWKGVVPGIAENSYRGELIAAAVAIGSIQNGSICSDNQAVVRIGNRLLAPPVDKREAALPADHRDLWLMFLRSSEDFSPGAVKLRWVKAHQDPSKLSGRDRILAIFNAFADKEAKSVVVECAQTALYRSFFDDVAFIKMASGLLADAHVGIAGLFTEEVPLRCPSLPLPSFSLKALGSHGW